MPASAAGDAEPHWEQHSDIVFRHYNPESGLPFAGATAIAQDKLGFLWIGSQNGIARWDGQRFRLYQAADPKSGLRDDLIKVLHVDRRGRLWVGTNAGGMALYDANSDRFIAYNPRPRGLSHAGIRDIADDGDRGLWVASSGGLDRVDVDRGIVKTYRHAAGEAGTLPSDHVSALLSLSPRILMVGSREGLSSLDPLTGQFRQIALPVRAGTAQPAIAALMADDRGRIWIGTVGAGAFLYDLKMRAAVPVLEHGNKRSSLPSETITRIVQSRPSEVWIATDGQGVVIIDTASGTTRRIVHEVGRASSLTDDAPVTLFRDRDGAMWVGSQRGLSRTDPSRTGVWTLFGGNQRRNAASSQDITSLFAASDGRIWLGMSDHGVEILDPVRGTVTPLLNRSAARLPPVPVASFAEAPDGHMYIGTNAGLFGYDPLRQSLAPVGLKRGQRAREITALLHEGKTLWIGRLDGLWRLDIGAAGPAEPVYMTESDRFGDQRVMAIVRGPDKALWVGTQNGLNRLVPGAGRVEQIRLNQSGSEGLIPTLVADRGRLWVGVYGRGLVVIENAGKPTRTIRHIGTAQGLPNANVDMLLPDDEGRIWASTDGGIAVIDAASLRVRPLQAEDGVAISAYWNGSGTRTAGGYLAFGGLGGITVVDPRQLAAANSNLPLVATEIRVGGKLVAGAAFNSIATAQELTVEPQFNSLSVEFAVLRYADPFRAHYVYRLRGYRDEWIEADAAHRTASFTNLPPGRYLLEIRSLSSPGYAQVAELVIKVRVLPAWYQTIWIKLVLLAGAIATFVGALQIRTAMLRRRQAELERIVTDRTQALSASQRELERIAFVDVLTGLPNRRRFNDMLRACIERADRRSVLAALILVDLDHFKAVNDTYGHDAGDALLSAVARKLRNDAGEIHNIARLGGDEFAIIVPEAAGTAELDQLCQRINDQLGQPVQFGDMLIPSGASIGIAAHQLGKLTPADLYKCADVALYTAKQRGRGSWAWFEGDAAPDMDPGTRAIDRRGTSRVGSSATDRAA